MKRNLRNAALMLAVVFLPLVGFALEDEPESPAGARGTEPGAAILDKAIPGKNIIALTYSLEVREGERWNRFTKDKLAKQEFQLGDFFRLVVDPVMDCHVYVFNQVDGGVATCIYPEPGRQMKLTGGSGEYVIPDPDPASQRERYFEFSPPAGSEKLYVVATTRKVTDRAVLAKVVTRKLEQETDRRKFKRSQAIKRAMQKLGRGAAKIHTGEALRLDANTDVYSDGIGLKTTADRP